MKVINTTAFILTLIIVLAYYFFSVHKWKTQNNKDVIHKENARTTTNGIPLAMMISDKNTPEDDELVAIITAAIHEFSGKDDLEVVRIRPSAPIWALTGRQNSLRT